jgi:hypothetical protein
MQTTSSPNPWHQECLGKLQQILDLAMQTAEAASTEGNHKIVLQAAREVTRIITLMTKLNLGSEPENDSQPLIFPPSTEPLVSGHLASATSPHPVLGRPRPSDKCNKAGEKTENYRSKINF